MAKTVKAAKKGKAKPVKPVHDGPGQPPLFKTAAQLQAKVDEYFEYIKGEFVDLSDIDPDNLTPVKWIRHPEPASIVALALYLGFCSRQSLFDYEQRPQYSYVIKKARARVEAAYEKNLSGQTPTGSIFALKNMGWRDKTETEHSGTVAVKQITGMEVK